MASPRTSCLKARTAAKRRYFAFCPGSRRGAVWKALIALTAVVELSQRSRAVPFSMPRTAMRSLYISPYVCSCRKPGVSLPWSRPHSMADASRLLGRCCLHQTNTIQRESKSVCLDVGKRIMSVQGNGCNSC